jgi:hypothetical protein
MVSARSDQGVATPNQPIAKGASMRLRRRLARVAVVGVLAGTLMAVSPGPAQADALTPRDCHTILSGDMVRRLDVCARGWFSTNLLYTRGVVEMHTYALLGGINDWVDSRSQSITMEYAYNTRDRSPVKDWGQKYGNCRVNGPGGSVACSVPNTVRVAFYGPQLLASNVNEWATVVKIVSWRDDRGVSHPNHWIDTCPPPPQPDDDCPLVSPPWAI